MGSRSFHKTDEPYPIANDAPEWERQVLDDMHKGINDYLGGKLSLAPIENPTKILEIGSGSGAWAIQAAQTYPEAEVLAVDISPLPPRPLPSNLKYQNLNVTLPFPFEQGSFDVVHTRFVLVHLPKFQEVLKRIVDLVKPGGWLLIEDIEHNLLGEAGPGITRFYEVYHGYMKPRNVDPMTGPLLEPLLKNSGAFSDVCVQKVVLPFSGKHEDPNVARLAKIMKISFSRAYKVLDPKLVVFGLTEEVQKGWYEETNDPMREVHADLYLTWSRKSE